MSDNATVTTQESPENQAPRTFTQDEVNAIVGKRLAEEKGKYADYDVLKAKADKYDEAEEAAKSELQKATEKAETYKAQLEELQKRDEVRSIREKVSAETGVPTNLLTSDTEEACKAQAEAILAFTKPTSYPSVKDGGEVHHTTASKPEDKFKEWFDANFK
jgi:hypothetical protein